MSNQGMENYRNAVAMVTAPDAFLELTTIAQGGQTLKAYKHAPGSMRDLWMLGQGYADQEYIVYGDERWTFAEAGQLVSPCLCSGSMRFVNLECLTHWRNVSTNTASML